MTTGRALPRRLFELVGPAAVIGHRPALEERVVMGEEARIVDEDDDDFPLHVEARVIVPILLGRDDAVAHEDQRRASDGDVRAIVLRRHPHGLVGIFERLGAVGARDGERGFRRIEGDRDRGNVLEIASFIARLETDALHLVGDPIGCAFARRRARPAALKTIVGNRLHTRREVRGIDGGGRLRMRRLGGHDGAGQGQRRGEQERRSQGRFHGNLCFGRILRLKRVDAIRTIERWLSAR